MRTAEILDALAKTEPGLLCTVGPNQSTVETLYAPQIRCSAPSLFKAARLVAIELHAHVHCPPAVSAALDGYEYHTACLQL